jgi:hypothetical protein
MTEFVHGPVKEWEQSDEDKVTIERLLASESELDRLYGEAYQLGFL